MATVVRKTFLSTLIYLLHLVCFVAKQNKGAVTVAIVARRREGCSSQFSLDFANWKTMLLWQRLLKKVNCTHIISVQTVHTIHL